QANRHTGQDQFDRARDQRRWGGLLGGSVRAGSGRPQWRAAPGGPYAARPRIMRAIPAVIALVVTALAACSATAPAPGPDLPRDMGGKVTADGMYTHLRKLQEIADANGGNRAEGTPGYDASVDYVVKVLKDKGFDVQTPEFERLERTEGGNPTLTVSGRGYPVDQASLLVPTPPTGLNAITLRPQKAPGCTAADYGTVPVKGAIAVVDDTGCSVVAKQNTAIAKGAVGMLVVSVPGAGGSPAGLFTSGYYQQLTVPVGVIDRDADTALRRTNAPVRLVLDSKPVTVKRRNVWRRPRPATRRMSCWRARTSTARRAAPASTTTGRRWRRYWKLRRRWARNPRSPMLCGSCSGARRQRVRRNTYADWTVTNSTTSRCSSAAMPSARRTPATSRMTVTNPVSSTPKSRCRPCLPVRQASSGCWRAISTWGVCGPPTCR